jgi:hypothetical protein
LSANASKPLPPQIGRYQIIAGELSTVARAGSKIGELRGPVILRLDTDTGLVWRLDSFSRDGTNSTYWTKIDPAEHAERTALRWWIATNQQLRAVSPSK